MDYIGKWFEFRKTYNDKTEEDLQEILRSRMIKLLKQTNMTQRMVARTTHIPESALSQWKNHKRVGFEKWGKDLDGDRMCQTTLCAESAGAILNLLEENGF
mgnify:CR=1 FL=1